MWSTVSVTIPSSEPDPTLVRVSPQSESSHSFFRNTRYIYGPESLQLHRLNKQVTHCWTFSSVSLSASLQGAVDGFEGCHWICGRSVGGVALTTGGGALLHLALWVWGSRDNAAVNTPDGDLWVLWKFNVTLRATCTRWGQRWACPGDGPMLPCVGALETKCQLGGPHQVLGLFCPLWHG